MAFRITGDPTEHLAAAVGAKSARVEVRATALGTLAVARLLHEEGYVNVRVTDADTGEPCDKAGLKRAAATGSR